MVYYLFLNKQDKPKHTNIQGKLNKSLWKGFDRRMKLYTMTIVLLRQLPHNNQVGKYLKMHSLNRDPGLEATQLRRSIIMRLEYFTHSHY